MRFLFGPTKQRLKKFGGAFFVRKFVTLKNYLVCDSAGLLQNGKPAQNQKWPKNGRRNGRQPFFGGAAKWPGKWPDMQKITKF